MVPPEKHDTVSKKTDFSFGPNWNKWKENKYKQILSSVRFVYVIQYTYVHGFASTNNIFLDLKNGTR